MEKTIIKTSYTWKKEFCLPYESKWGRIAKFCYLNAYTYSVVNTKKGLKKELCKDIELPWYYGNRHFLLNEANQRELKICPLCMEYGYHSYLHQIEGETRCFLHHSELKIIPKISVVASKSGTYDIFRINPEKIVNNEDLKSMIMQYNLRLLKKKLVYATFQFPQGAFNKITCYNSMRQLFRSVCLTFDEHEPRGYECIQSILYDDVEKENMHIFYDIVKTYTKQYVPSRTELTFSLFDDKTINSIGDIANKYLNHQSAAKYCLNTDELAGCVQIIVSDIVEKRFDNIDEWYKISDELRNIDTSNKIQLSNLFKYAIVIAVQAIIGYDDANNVWHVESRYWKRYAEPVSYALNILDEFYEILRYKRIPGYNYGPFASQYIIYPILQDLLNHLIDRSYNLLLNGTIRISANMKSAYDSDIWDAPQYAVLYYNDHVEIYKCESDNIN